MDFTFNLGSATSKKMDQNKLYDVIVVGGGPAGMNAALYAARKGLSTGIVTFDFGGQTLETSTIENYIGFKEILGSELAEKWKEHMLEYGVETHEFVHVNKIEKKDNIFEIFTDDNSIFKGKTVIVATGKRSRPMGVPGEKELTGKGVAYCATCDAPLYAGKTVGVVGGGNSAIEAIVDLGKIAKKVYVFQNLSDYTADKIVVEKLNEYKDKIETYFDTLVTEVKGDTRLEKAVIKNVKTNETKEIELDGLFVEIGLIPNSDFVKDFVKLNKYNEIEINDRCETSVPGVFAAGDVTTVPFKQVVISAGEGAKAALAANDYLLNSK